MFSLIYNKPVSTISQLIKDMEQYITISDPHYRNAHNFEKIHMLLSANDLFTVNDTLLKMVEQFMANPTTKICPECCSDQLVLLQSTNEKICSRCYTNVPWKLTTNQQP